MATLLNCSIIVPVYNGAETIPLLVERLRQVLSGAVNLYEVILVNDGSPDGSWEVIQQLARRYPWVRGIDLMRNYGQHNATLCGVRAARYEVTITMDDDLQNPPEEIPKLLAKLEEGYDVVYGVPRQRQRDWWRSIFSALVKRVISYVMGIRTVRDIGAYKVFRTHLRDAFAYFNGPDVLLDVLLSWGTNRFASVQVEESPRMSGKSNYNFLKLVKVFFLVLTSYTTLPLQFASLIGFAFTIFGVIGFLYVLLSYLLQGSVPGFPFLASAIMISSGVQFFTLGIIGEYLGRVFNRTGGRPPYAIARTVNGPE